MEESYFVYLFLCQHKDCRPLSPLYLFLPPLYPNNIWTWAEFNLFHMESSRSSQSTQPAPTTFSLIWTSTAWWLMAGISAGKMFRHITLYYYWLCSSSLHKRKHVITSCPTLIYYRSYSWGSDPRPPFDDGSPGVEQVGGGKGLNLTIYLSPRWTGWTGNVSSLQSPGDGTLTLPSPACYLLYTASR